MTFKPGYAMATAALLCIELGIALFVRDAFVRPHLGDVLAVMLVYCALRTVTRLGVAGAVSLAFAIAMLIEFGQLAGLVDLLGLRGSPAASAVLGTGFDPWDFLAYAAGAVGVIAVEGLRRRASNGADNGKGRTD